MCKLLNKEPIFPFFFFSEINQAKPQEMKTKNAGANRKSILRFDINKKKRTFYQLKRYSVLEEKRRFKLANLKDRFQIVKAASRETNCPVWLNTEKMTDSEVSAYSHGGYMLPDLSQMGPSQDH